MEYEQRTVIFIDILGFKNMVKNTSELRIISDALKKLYTIKERKALHTVEDEYVNSLQVGMFSDNIVISCNPKHDYYLFNDAMDLQLELMARGIFVRGCISIGNLIHEGNFLFGPALVKAYQGETSMAKFPRIIMDETVNYAGTICSKDFDGITFLDFFRRLNDNYRKNKIDLDYSVREIYGHVENKLKEHNKNLNIRSKFEWIKGLMDEVFYISEGKFKYFNFTNTTYDRIESFSCTRLKLMEVLNEKREVKVK